MKMHNLLTVLFYAVLTFSVAIYLSIGWNYFLDDVNFYVKGTTSRSHSVESIIYALRVNTFFPVTIAKRVIFWPLIKRKKSDEINPAYTH